MANLEETFVLAEMRTVTLADGSNAEVIRTVVRTYLSSRRAETDLQLLGELLPDINYRVLPIAHIDA